MLTDNVAMRDENFAGAKVFRGKGIAEAGHKKRMRRVRLVEVQSNQEKKFLVL